MLFACSNEPPPSQIRIGIRQALKVDSSDFFEEDLDPVVVLCCKDAGTTFGGEETYTKFTPMMGKSKSVLQLFQDIGMHFSCQSFPLPGMLRSCGNRSAQNRVPKRFFRAC
jgi:hypothetical protein